MHQR